MDTTKPACKSLVLDAGPLLSLSPLRGLAEHYITVPQVLSELKDKNAREHFERLGISAGVQIEVREPDALSLAKVIQFAKKTGDYSVLSHADLCVLALTLALDTQAVGEKTKELELNVPEESKPIEDTTTSVDEESSGKTEAASETTSVDVVPSSDRPSDIGAIAEDGEMDEGGEDILITSDGSSKVDEEEPSGDEAVPEADADEEVEREPLDITLEPLGDDSGSPRTVPSEPPKLLAQPPENGPIFEDPSDDDDGEGEWITPANVDLYKSKVLDLLPSSNSSSDPFTLVVKKGKEKGKKRRQGGENDEEAGPKEQIAVGCMTADFAMQNVILQMGLSLVGIEGKRIEKVKTWVLRCHACFKICKDSTKKFCPSCGNPTLLRTSVTAKSPTATESTPVLQVHLKKNFVYRTRGTIYSIPAPKPGSSKKGSGEGLILREDQSEYLRARRHEDGRRTREERKLVQGALEAARKGNASSVRMGSWTDPDWVPEMLSVGSGGKGRRAPEGRGSVGADGMPVIGYGRKNPNEKRRKK